MNSLTKSGRRKRESQEDREFRQRKRVRLENFFTETASPEDILHRFHNQTEKLENEDINPTKLANLTKCIKQLKRRDLLKHLNMNDVMKVIKNLTNFIKVGFIKDFKSSYELDPIKWKSNVEVTFEACLICLSLMSCKNISEGEEGEDFDVYINDIIFFLRKVFDDVNMQLIRVKDVKKINSITLKELLLDNLGEVNELIRIRQFNSLNITGLITSFLETVLYHRDLIIQKSALESIISFYRKGDEFRALVLNLTFKSIGRLHEHYKFKKTYSINNSISVNLFTVLIMALVENVPISGFHSDESYDTSVSQKSQKLLRESFENVMKVTCFIIKTFIQKAGTISDCHKIYNQVFGQLVMDLIQVSNEPEWPSAKLILNLLLKPLTEIIMKPPAEAPLRIFAAKALSEIIKQKMVDKIVYDEILELLKQKFRNLDEECDFTEFTQSLLVRHISSAKKTEFNVNYIFLHALQWFDNLQHKPNFEEKVSNLMKLFKGNDSSELADIDQEETRAILYHLDTMRRNYVDYNIVLKYLLRCYYDRNRKVKFIASQYIFEIINLDPGLLSQSMVSNIVHENLLFSPTAQKEKLCALIDKHLTIHPEKCGEYAPLLIWLLDVQSDFVRKICIDLMMKIIKTQTNVSCKVQVCYKIFTLMQRNDPILQKQVIDFFTHLWLDETEDNVEVLLAITEIPNASKYLRLVFEDKLKPSPLSLTDTSQPTIETFDSCGKLIRIILDKIERNEDTLHCLQIISTFVTLYPKAFIRHLFVIAGPLTRPNYTEDFAVEILTAEILNYILPEVINPEVLHYVSLRSSLVDKIMSDDGLNFTMGLTVSLLKLVNNLSEFDRIFISENCLQPSMDILQQYGIQQESADNRIISRALCIVIYLHVNFPCEIQHFQPILNFFIEHRIFGLTTIHCLCYLSMDYKPIMGNESVTTVIYKHLKDKRYPVLLRAVLYNILCSLKNIKEGQWMEKNVEPVKNLVQKHITDILDCLIDQRSEIRQITYGIVRQLLMSGLIPETRLVPSVLLMSTDPVDALAQVAVHILNKMNKKNLIDFMRNAAKCLIASLAFNLKCLKQDFIRGYVIRKGKLEAKCNHFYLLHQEEINARRQFIDSIIKGIIPEGETTANEKLYLAENIAFFTYKYQEEIYYVLSQIQTVLTTTRIPDVPNDPEDKVAYIQKFYGLYILTHVKNSLMSHYGFSGNKLWKYYQDDEKRDLVQTKKNFICEIPKIPEKITLPNMKDIQILCDNIFNAVKKHQKPYIHQITV